MAEFDREQYRLGEKLDIKDFIFLFDIDDLKTPEKVLKVPTLGDYILVWDKEGEKRFLAKTISVDTKKKTIDIMVIQSEEPKQKGRKGKTDFLSLDFVIGPEIENGETYDGFLTKILIKSYQTKMGRLDIYRKEKPEILQTNLIGTINDIFEKYSSSGFPKIFPIQLSFLPNNGKLIGHYQKTSDEKDHLEIQPKDFPYKEMDRLIWHELGHGIEFNRFDDKIQANWLEMYDSFNKVIKDTNKTLQHILKTLLEHGSKTEEKLSPIELDFLEEAFVIILDKSNLSREDLYTLILQNKKSTIIKVWPSSIMWSKRKNVLTKYASKSSSEFWCESFSFLMTNRKLYPAVKKLVLATLRDV